MQSWKEEEKPNLCCCFSGSGRDPWALRHMKHYSGFQSFCCKLSTLVLEILPEISYDSCIFLDPWKLDANTGIKAFAVPSSRNALFSDAHIVHRFSSLGSNVTHQRGLLWPFSVKVYPSCCSVSPHPSLFFTVHIQFLFVLLCVYLSIDILSESQPQESRDLVCFTAVSSAPRIVPGTLKTLNKY